MRRAQLIELKYADRITAAGSDSLAEDEHLYMGSSTTRGLIMASPMLQEYVASELHKEASTAKEKRKLREERALSRAPPKRV